MLNRNRFAKIAYMLDDLGLTEVADLIDAKLTKQAGNLYVPVKELPATLQEALRSVGYHNKDKDVKAADKV